MKLREICQAIIDDANYEGTRYATVSIGLINELEAELKNVCDVKYVIGQIESLISDLEQQNAATRKAIADIGVSAWTHVNY